MNIGTKGSAKADMNSVFRYHLLCMIMEKRLNLIEKLRNKENFTSAESSLADYILNNIDDVYRMSLQDLAKASYVSKPSVIRLYRKVGCLNYQEFSIGLQLEKIRNDDGTAMSFWRRRICLNFCRR